MKTLLKLEELVLFLFSIALFTTTGYAWWWFPLLLLGPDISIAGYLFNSKIGAAIYNLFHHRGFAILIYLTGFILANPVVQLTGIILFGHLSIDRLFGYGLKYSDSFKHTHLGWIGQRNE